MVMPGDNVTAVFELMFPVPLDAGVYSTILLSEEKNADDSLSSSQPQIYKFPQLSLEWLDIFLLIPSIVTRVLFLS